MSFGDFAMLKMTLEFGIFVILISPMRGEFNSIFDKKLNNLDQLPGHQMHRHIVTCLPMMEKNAVAADTR